MKLLSVLTRELGPKRMGPPERKLLAAKVGQNMSKLKTEQIQNQSRCWKQGQDIKSRSAEGKYLPALVYATMYIPQEDREMTSH